MSGLTSEILFEKFQIIEVLKKDEHAGVYLANHIYLSKKIILKVLNTQKIHDPSLVERFKREAKILARLDHPNIIKVFDFGLSNEYFYISFEYIEGESLRSVFKTKTLSLEQKEHLLIQLLKGLDYAHKNQIIHRDIKPENIFIDNNLNAKLGDFGLALSAEDNFVTSPYAIVGTPSYMSPEQVRGAKLTAQSDLFSLGVVLLELFTGTNPFLKDNVTLTLNEINSYNEDSLKEKLAEVPEKYRDIFAKLLKKNVNQRYNSAEEIFKELNIQIDQPTIIINNINRPRIQSKLVWLLALAVILIIAGIIFYPKMKDEKQNTLPNVNQNSSQNITQTIGNNSAAKQNELSKEQVDLTKTNQPLVNNQEQQKTNNSINNDQNKIKGYGSLFIDVKPYADVLINGVKFYSAPFNEPKKLLEGEYSVRIVNGDYPPYPAQTITIKADSIVRLNINLNSTVGFIQFMVQPFGDIFVDGEKKGHFPPLLNVKVNPGVHRVFVSNPNYTDIDTIIKISKGETLKLNFAMKKK